MTFIFQIFTHFFKWCPIKVHLVEVISFFKSPVGFVLLSLFPLLLVYRQPKTLNTLFSMAAQSLFHLIVSWLTWSQHSFKLFILTKLPHETINGLTM